MTTNTAITSILNRKNIIFALLTTFIVLFTHAIAYLSHEYAHSFLAWAMGFKSDPFALNYGSPTWHNIILLSDIDENVDYKQIIDSGNGLSGGIIALSGAGIGNGFLYFVCYWLTGLSFVRSKRWAITFLYWLSLMDAANLLSYAPLRVITTHGDMAITAQCFGITTWTLLPFVTAGTFYLMYHFFFKMFPKNYLQVAGRSYLDLVFMIVMTSYWYFGFFGSDGTTIFPLISKYFFIPFSAMFLASRYLDLSLVPNKAK